MPDIAFVKPALPRAGALVLLLAEEAPLAGLAEQADKAANGAIARGLEAAKFKGRKGQSTTLWAPGGGVSKVVAIGLGKQNEIAEAGLEATGGTIAGAMAQEREATVAADGLTAAQAAGVAFGIALKSYRFDRYRTTEKEEDKPKLERVAMGVAEPAKAKAAYAPLQAIADGVFLTRDLVSEPPNVLTPAECAERCKALTKLGVEVEVLGPREMKRLGFGALLGVAQGSANEPRMVVMKWMGAPKGKKPAGRPLAFIGKGVTFDTGGISIKPAGGMEDMKWDMAGAGTVIGLMAALAGRKAKADVIGIVGLVENMPSGTAQRPGDVVKTASGQTVEVINTDAEGRLVLADVIHYCIEKFDPRFMIDLATLTGAIIIALGHEHAGLFANDDTLAQRIEAAGRAVGEPCWRMPLGDAYDKQIKSDIADMKNVGGRPGGSITAAQFIQRFVQGKPWAHLDIAGTAWSSKDAPTVPKGATAYGVRMLDRLVAEHYEG
ncbi:leucyl aminopeptidase [Neoroseomonas rubea]|uniref:leucyl aminopeptidase n=1 Tax=Neoroseomonas rubea TaxID=2748666 RepID=UPI0018DFAA40|nr:leucyl aminopeptidase [Roseomonas rubea]